ncbi:asparagine synthase (glutamine-hydrolyzing) [Povalibacter uvarum]|uniref:asparagine synthase (glutamine-hydrolyzing) n=1 Tax=Povalibacter uvarum TaxID=732238 RepID=A0A841HGF2_9GAMM|nr:asparagine synthase (glutamine-hydrolyzing) [Povalibacter uvarum]MBB6091644.1 asparagine synthase (glutamine-hydrolyzing) [Povalibacter uvarum]
MCGIAGIYYFDSAARVEQPLLERMTSVISHRGPNGHGFFIDGQVGLGHRRLSVIDLDGGGQPMIDEPSRRVIVYNGEIFNYRELRETLKNGGTSFRTKSDTEVLLKLANPAVESWAHELNGMFAFALWDPRERSLLVMRDRFGVKPLYYVSTPEFFAFSSEIKSLLQIPGVRAEVNTDSVAEYLAFRHVLEPSTFLKGVQQLPGGHYIHITPGSRGVQIKRWWSETEALARFRASGAADASLLDMLSSSVSYRLVSDVPLGTFNSGGVDSSLITREVRNHKVGELHTFSVGFSEQSHDESKYAQEVAGKLGTIHHAEYISVDQYAESLPKAIWHNDEPLCHPHSVHLMHLCGIASKYVTVALTGEGADELFAGYPRLRIPLYSNAAGPLGPWVGRLASSTARGLGMRRLRKLFDAMSGDVDVRIDSHRFIDRDDLDALKPRVSYVGSREALRSGIPANQPFLEQLLEYERRSYMQSLVVRLDKMAMAHGLEARTPFLDYRMVLWSKTRPASEKVGSGWANKPTLKAECARTFSHELVYRPKVGFGVPLTVWFRQQPAFRSMLDDMSGDKSIVSNLFPRDVIRRLVSEHTSSKADHTEALWVLLNIHLWQNAIAQPAASH